ncbi:MAG: Gfo/Idh/MocA family oxidoreductase [Desulfobacula sp.]|jgi:predicted dehydrogenase|nr:Gfo/Idh/MocA family oxidoreductase [Desulfobacula sp.]
MPETLQRHLIVGLGSIGKRHAGVLIKNGCDIAGVDPFPVGSYDFPVYTSLEKGFDFNPDMVWLCSPTQCHADQAIIVIEKGIHLFIEKPVAHTLEHAEKILDCYENHDRKQLVWVGCNMRFHPAVINLKAFLEKGLIGKPLILRLHFSHWLPNMRPVTDYRTTYAVEKDGGGIILDDIHDIDLALFFAGPVKKMNGMSLKSGCLDMEAEDIASFNLVHENNIFSQIHMDFLRKDKSRGIEIVGEQGTMEWKSLGKNPEMAKIKLYSLKDNKCSTLFNKKIADFDQLFYDQFKSLVQRFKDKKKFGTSLYESFGALKIANNLKGKANE